MWEAVRILWDFRGCSQAPFHHFRIHRFFAHVVQQLVDLGLLLGGAVKAAPIGRHPRFRVRR